MTTSYLLDTNIVSELVRPRPSPAVVAFLENETDLWLSAIVFHELAYGCELATLRKKGELLTFISSIKQKFGQRVLSVDLEIAETAGRLRAFDAAQGRILHPLDALLAATAAARGLTLVTRNEKDFASLNIPLLNPWTTA